MAQEAQEARLVLLDRKAPRVSLGLPGRPVKTVLLASKAHQAPRVFRAQRVRMEKTVKMAPAALAIRNVCFRLAQR